MCRCGVGQQLLLIKFRSPDNTYWIKIVRKKGSDAKRIKIKRCGGGRENIISWVDKKGVHSSVYKLKCADLPPSATPQYCVIT